MFPYVQIDAVFLGPIVLQPFGVLVLLAGVVGWTLMMARARSLGLDMPEFRAACTWALVVGAVMAHVLDAAFYHPDDVAKDPWSLLYLWNGLSSVGGLVGAALGGVAWRHVGFAKRGPVALPYWRDAPMPLLPAADVIVPCFAISWIFGRLGCAIVHDHVSARVPLGTPLAVAFPAPGDAPSFVAGPLRVFHGTAPRYDLGLFELAFTIVLAVALLATWRRALAVGARVAVVCIAYAPVRFAMDYLRDTDGELGDRRMAHLTFAQWSSIAVFAFGVYVAARPYVAARARRLPPSARSRSVR